MTAEPRAEFGLLDRVVAPAADVAAAVAFYRDVLGATVQSASADAAAVRLANVDVGIRRRGPAAATAADAGPTGIPGWEPAFRVADIAAVRARLVAAGVAITRDLHDVEGGVALAFRDPDGNPLAVCQYGTTVAELRGAF